MKQFKVVLLINHRRTEVILGGANLAGVYAVARSMFKKEQVLSVIEIK